MVGHEHSSNNILWGKIFGVFLLVIKTKGKWKKNRRIDGNCILINNSSKTIQDVWDASAVKSLVIWKDHIGPCVCVCVKKTKENVDRRQMKNLSATMSSCNKDSFLASASYFAMTPLLSPYFTSPSGFCVCGWNRTIWSFHIKPAWNKILHFFPSSYISLYSRNFVNLGNHK